MDQGKYLSVDGNRENGLGRNSIILFLNFIKRGSCCYVCFCVFDSAFECTIEVEFRLKIKQASDAIHGGDTTLHVFKAGSVSQIVGDKISSRSKLLGSSFGCSRIN